MQKTIFDKMECRKCIFFDYKSNQKLSTSITFPHGKKYELKKSDGTIVQYDFISDFHEGYACVELDHKQGFINEQGEEICPIKYDICYMRNPSYTDMPRTMSYTSFSDGYARVAIPDSENKFLRFGYINTEGKEVCPFIYSQCDDFHNGKAIVTRNGKQVVINKKFEEISKEYDRISNFVFGYAKVMTNNLYGFIDENGNEICEVKFDLAYNFDKDGFAEAYLRKRKEYLIQLIDKNGKEYYMENGEIYPFDN